MTLPTIVPHRTIRTAPVPNIETTITVGPKLKKPVHQNTNLEELIHGHHDKTELHLSYERLTADDMQLVAYYALQENMVRNTLFLLLLQSFGI